MKFNNISKPEKLKPFKRAESIFFLPQLTFHFRKPNPRKTFTTGGEFEVSTGFVFLETAFQKPGFTRGGIEFKIKILKKSEKTGKKGEK